MAQSTLSFVQAFSSIVLAVFTAVLAFVTWKYYGQTKIQSTEIAHQTREMGKARELKHEPRLKAGIMPFAGPNWCIAFVNIGGGIAQEVQAKYWISGFEDYRREWGTQIHFPEDKYQIGFPLEEEELVTGMPENIKSRLSSGTDTLHVEWEFKDASGTSFEYSEEISIISAMEKRTKGEFYTGEGREVRF